MVIKLESTAILCSMVTANDVRAVIQNHLRKIRVIDSENMNPFYLFYLPNTNLFQQQVEMKTFTQATLSTLGNQSDFRNLFAVSHFPPQNRRNCKGHPVDH